MAVEIIPLTGFPVRFYVKIIIILNNNTNNEVEVTPENTWRPSAM